MRNQVRNELTLHEQPVSRTQRSLFDVPRDDP
jgi:hypothetical protein